MSGWMNIYYKLLNLLLHMLVKSKSIPAEPVLELGFDTSCPIIYILPYNSMVDLLTLRNQCLAHNLPDPTKPLQIGSTVLPCHVFLHGESHILACNESNKELIELFYDYLNLHHSNPNLNMQMIPVSVMFGRRPGRQKKREDFSLRKLNGIQKFFAISWLGRDSFVRFSPSVSLRLMADKHDTDKIIIQKLVRVARMYFARQHLATIGPVLPARKDLFNKLLASKKIIRAIEDEVRNKKVTYKKAQQNAIVFMKEIAANSSYEMIRISDRILSFTWYHCYQGINVHNAARVRQLAHDGHEIVYVPCHRSHMDYLLLSYVLYHQGLVAPHIAAGINLNFWPIGPIFRRLGAFFIRRTFKGNKLYSAVFREYLSELFSRGYPVEYFVEGGRSRTGRLLEPKTGTLSITIQTMLRGDIRPITIVPIYIGYEHVMEIGTYSKELRGAIKEKESLLKMLRGLSKLRNFGHVYVNFGEPMQLITWLNNHVPTWRESVHPIETVRPSWLMPAVNAIATELMVRINNAGAANAMNLCCTALLASRHRSLTRKQLIEQLECYLDIMRNAPYSADSTIPNDSATQLIDHALQLDKFIVKSGPAGDVIILSRKQAILMTYYRNNIAHMLMLPSLMAAIITQHHRIKRNKLFHYIEELYPMLKSELFLRWEKDELSAELYKLIFELLRQDLLIATKDDEISINPKRFHTLQLLAGSACETLQRYAIAFWLLSNKPLIKKSSLENKSRMLAQRLSMFYGINAPEFFDKSIFSTLVLTLRNEGYIYTTDDTTKSSKTMHVYQILAELIDPDVRVAIESATYH